MLCILVKASEWRSAFWLILMHFGKKVVNSLYLLMNPEYVAARKKTVVYLQVDLLKRDHFLVCTLVVTSAQEHAQYKTVNLIQ